MPFSRSRLVPGHLSRGSRTRLATHPPPCTETILSISRQVSVAGCQRQPPAKSQRLRPRTIPYRIILLSTQHTSLNTFATIAGGPVPKDRPHPVRLATAARPETHQNLIYSNKDHAPGLTRRTAHQRALQRHHQSIHRTTCRNNLPRNNPGNTEPLASPRYIRQRSSDTNHLNTIPGGGDRTRTDDPLLAKQVLSQLSYTPETVLSLQSSVLRKTSGN